LIGIGITTRNREEIFRKTLANIKKFIPANARLVVVDDNSDEPKKNLDVDEYFYFKERVGIAKSKNKCLELLEDCDHIFLYDDDFYPVKKGWEKIYINTAKLIGCHHLCFTFDFGDPVEKVKPFKVLNDVERSLFNSHEQAQYDRDLESYLESIKKREQQISKQERNARRKKESMHDAWESYFRVTRRLNIREAIDEMRTAKIRSGLYNDHDVIVDEKFNHTKHIVKFHLHPNGVMMYIDQECLKQIGGFATDRPMYGGEHGSYSHRAYNAGLIPNPYADANDSSSYFCKYYNTLSVESVVSLKEREENEKAAEKKFKSEHRTFDFYDYKQSK